MNVPLAISLYVASVLLGNVLSIWSHRQFSRMMNAKFPSSKDDNLMRDYPWLSYTVGSLFGSSWIIGVLIAHEYSKARWG